MPLVPPKQMTDFRAALVERLDLNPETVVADSIDVDVNGGEGTGFVTVKFALPADELIRMFNEAGR